MNKELIENVNSYIRNAIVRNSDIKVIDMTKHIINLCADEAIDAVRNAEIVKTVMPYNAKPKWVRRKAAIVAIEKRMKQLTDESEDVNK